MIHHGKLLTMKKQIAVLVTDFVDDVGHEVTSIGFDLNKEPSQESLVQRLRSIKPGNFYALFIPDGFSPDQLCADQRFVDFVKYFLAKNKITASIFHGPQLVI